MKLKIGLLVAGTIFLVIALFNVPLIFTQAQFWDYCHIDAYGIEAEDELEVKSLSFTIVAPPTGSDIPNTISVRNNNSGENYTDTLVPGDKIYVIYEDAITKELEDAPVEDHFTIFYEGSATYVSINSVIIPEFTSILIIPMFMIATLLAIVYRRRRTPQLKQ